MSTATVTKQATSVKESSSLENKAPELSFEQLLEKMAKLSLTPEEKKRLDVLYSEKEKAIVGRRTAIAEVVKLITKQEITLAEMMEMEAFSKDEIVGLYQGMYPQTIGKKPKVISTGDKQTRTPKDYGINLVSIKVPNTKGKATTLSVDTPFPAESVKFGASFQYLKDMKDGNPRANFEKFVIDTPEAKEYLVSKDGDAWVQKWVGWISRGGKKEK